MADDSAPVPSIKSRISALNLEQVGTVPGTPPPFSYEAIASKKARPPPPPPPSKRPNPALHSHSTNNPPTQSNGTGGSRTIGNQPNGNDSAGVLSPPILVKSPPPPPTQSPGTRPALPPRPARSSGTDSAPPPALPPRRPTEENLGVRRPSVESIASTMSARSSMSAISTRTSASAVSNGTNSTGRQFEIKAPPFDPSKLPPLPPKKEKREEEKLKPGARKVPLRPAKSTTSVVPSAVPARTVKAPLPILSAKREEPTDQTHGTEEVNSAVPPALPSRPALPGRPAARQVRSALGFAMNKSTETAPAIPQRPSTTSDDATVGAPPPVPLSSRPNLAALQASKPRPVVTASTNCCLKCRDFSGLDAHAARFPRESIPSTDLGWLAHQLTSPFPSHTDKARVIFTWLHHNIEYNTQAFFSGNVKPSTPASTFQTGLAVCEGYAALFTALASKVGLESLVVGGHGKGFGFAAMKAGSRVPPPDPTGHAWNAVKIDNGEWKLIDCCWGAGNVNGPNMPYNKDFTSSMFTMDNNEFGTRHFPEDPSKQFRTDGRVLTWQDYMLDDMGERVQTYSSIREHGIGERTLEPAMKYIRVHDPNGPSTVRFSFAAVCQHWSQEKCTGKKPCVMILKIGGRDGRKEDFVPFECTGSVGSVWWVDVPRVELGAAGQTVSVYAVTEFGGKEGWGVTLEEYKMKKGRVGMAFAGIAMYELV